jgi:fibronectin-binding autotransporter adhesin
MIMRASSILILAGVLAVSVPEFKAGQIAEGDRRFGNVTDSTPSTPSTPSTHFTPSTPSVRTHSRHGKHKPAPISAPTPALGGDPNYTRSASNTSGTADQWSAGTNWDATPTSGTATQLVFGGAGPTALAAGATIFTNNDIAGTFSLNKFDFTYSGPASGAQPTVTVSGNPLQFVSNGATTPTMNLNGTGTVKPLLTVSNNIVLTNNLSITGSSDGILSGVISGAGNLTKTGAGTLTLSNTNSTYSGTLTVQSGTLKIDTANNASSNGELGNSANSVILGGSGTTGTLEYTGGTASSSKTFTMATGGTGAFQIDTAATNLTLSGVINGGGGLLKTGGGTLILSGATNTYTGPTTINAGTLTLQLGAVNTSQINSASMLVLGGGTLNDVLVNKGLLTFASTTINPGSSSVVVSGGGGQASSVNLAAITRNTGSTVDFSISGSNTSITTTTPNAIITGGQQTILGGYATVGGNTWAVSGTGGTAGAITGLALANYSTGFVAGKDVNATTGTSTPAAMTINSLRFNSAGAYTVNTGGNLTIATGGILETTGVGANAVSINSNNLTSGNGQDLIVIQNNTSGNMTIGSNIVDNGTIGLTKSGAGTLILTGTNTYSGTTTINTGTLQVGAGGTAGTLGSGSVTDNAALSFNRSDAISVGNTISGTGSLSQAGSGSTTLTGANTYSGGTTVSAGTLFVNNSTGSGTGTGAVVVNNSGTLAGSGTISGAVTLNNSAKINAGGTAGAIGTLTTGALTLNNTSILSVDMTSGSGNADKVIVNGNVILATNSVLQLVIPNGTTFGAGETFTLIDPSGTSPAFTGAFSNAPTGTDIINGYAWMVSYAGGDGNDFVLTAVPEPSTWAAGALALAAVGYTQRRRFVRLFARV